MMPCKMPPVAQVLARAQPKPAAAASDPFGVRHLVGDAAVPVTGKCAGANGAQADVWYFPAEGHWAAKMPGCARASLAVPHDPRLEPTVTLSGLFTLTQRAEHARWAVRVHAGAEVPRYGLADATARVSRADIQFAASATLRETGGRKVFKVWVPQWGVSVYLDPENVTATGVPIEDQVRACGVKC